MNGAVIEAYNEFGIKSISRLETDLFDRLIDTEGGVLTLILSGQAYDGISVTSSDLNWLNRVGSTETLTGKKILANQELQCRSGSFD